jgi:hypothetical protein
LALLLFLLFSSLLAIEILSLLGARTDCYLLGSLHVQTILLSWDGKGRLTKTHDSYDGALDGAVSVKINDYFGVRYQLTTRQVALFFSCKGVHFRFVHGFNAPVAVLDTSDPLFDHTDRVGAIANYGPKLSTAEVVQGIQVHRYSK